MVSASVEGLDAQSLRELAERTLKGRKAAVVAIVSVLGEKANLVVALSGEAARAGLDAVGLAKRAGRLLGGGGGGRAEMAVGGGSDTSRTADALAQVVQEAGSRLERGHA